MLVVRLGPEDIETLIDHLDELSRDEFGVVAFDVTLGADEDGLKVREGSRWTAPIGKATEVP